MPTDTIEAPAATETPAPAPAPELSQSFADILDAALGTEKVSAAPVTAPDPAPVAEAPAKEEAKTADSFVPSSIMDEIGKIGLEEKTKTAEAETPKDAVVEEKLPENIAPAAQTAFAKLTKELREVKTKLKEFESKATDRTEAVEKKGEDATNDTQLKEFQAKIELLAKERDELDSELRLSRIEATREYRSNITEPVKAAVQTISEIAKVYEIKPNSILETATEPDGAKRRTMLKEMTSEMDAADALSVRLQVDELVKLNGKREEMIRDSKSTLEALTRAEEEQERSERQKYDTEAKKAFGEVWDNFQNEMPLLKKIDGNENWNKTIDEIRTQAEKLDSEPLDHRQRAALTFQAVTLPLVVKVFKDYVAKTNQEMASLKNNLSDYRKATPGAGGGQAVDKSEKLDSSLSFLDALEKG